MSNQDFLTQPHGVVGVLGQEAKWLVGEEFLKAYESDETVIKFWPYGEKEDTSNLAHMMRAYKIWLQEGMPFPWNTVVDFLYEEPIAWAPLEIREKEAHKEISVKLKKIVSDLWEREPFTILRKYDPDMRKRTWIGSEAALQVADHILTTIHDVENKYRVHNPPIEPRLARICEAYWRESNIVGN